MSWLLFTLLAINLWAVANIIDKNVVSKKVKNSVTPVIIGSFTSIFYSILSFLIFRAAFSVEGLILGFVWVVIILLYFKVLQLEEASRVIIFYNLTPVFVASLAYFFLGEVFTLEKYTGIILLVLGAALISIKKGVNIKIGRAAPFMFLAVLTYAIYSIGMKYFVDEYGFASIFSSMLLGFFIGGSALFFPYRKEIVKLKSKTVYIILASQLLGIAGLLSIIYAASIGQISLISAMENVQAFFVLIYATALTIFKPRIIKENVQKGPVILKLGAILMMAIGAYFVNL